MELLEFTPENCFTDKRRMAPVVSFNFKSGVVSFNGMACEKIGLNEGDLIKFHQDKNDPENWYIEKVKEGGFALRKNRAAKTRSLIFNNAKLCSMVSESVEYRQKSGRTLIAGQPTKFEKRTLWGILTIALRNQN